MRDLPDIKCILSLVTDAWDEALVARCHAIAARERPLGDAPYRVIAAELAAIYGVAEAPALLARLAADIRGGRYDEPGAERTRLARLLWRLTILKLQESNPAFLEGIKDVL